jgi:MFS family permease
MSVGLAGASLSMVLSAFATQPWHLVVTFGLLYPLAGRKSTAHERILVGMISDHRSMSQFLVFYMPAAILLFEWFQQRRGMASGIMYAGTGAGGTVFPFIVQALLHSFGYKAAMISLVSSVSELKA